MTLPSDDRAALAKAYHWAARGMTVAIGMVVPGMAGYFVDNRLGTKVLFTILGFAFGMAFGIWQLLQLAHATDQSNRAASGKNKESLPEETPQKESARERSDHD